MPNKGKGFWGKKSETKHQISRARRQVSKGETEELLICSPVTPYSSVEEIEKWISELESYPDKDETRVALEDAKQLLKERKAREAK